MIIERNSKTNVGFTAFQKIPGSTTKVGFICEAETMSKAIAGVVDLVARHCSITGAHPAEITPKGRATIDDCDVL